MGGLLRDNPCKHCVPPTRREGCHNENCPRGWYEWDQEHKKLKEEEAKEKAVNVGLDGQRKSNILKELRHKSKMHKYRGRSR